MFHCAQMEMRVGIVNKDTAMSCKYGKHHNTVQERVIHNLKLFIISLPLIFLFSLKQNVTCDYYYFFLIFTVGFREERNVWLE